MSEANHTNTALKKFESFLEGLTHHELTVLNRMVVDRIHIMHKANTLMSMSKFHIGDRVSWDGSDGIIRSGTIIRMNQKTVSVKIDDASYWNVSPQLLRNEN